MKIRSDYVTNSSSSSFVIAYKDLPEIDDETICKYPFLKNYVRLIENILFTEGDYDTDCGVKISSKAEYNEFFVERYGWGRTSTIESILKDDQWLTEHYNEAIKALDSGFNILCKNVDIHDTYCSKMIQSLAEDTESFIIIEGD